MSKQWTGDRFEELGDLISLLHFLAAKGPVNEVDEAVMPILRSTAKRLTTSTIDRDSLVVFLASGAFDSCRDENGVIR